MKNKFRGALECNGDRHMTVLEAASVTRTNVTHHEI